QQLRRDRDLDRPAEAAEDLQLGGQDLPDGLRRLPPDHGVRALHPLTAPRTSAGPEAKKPPGPVGRANAVSGSRGLSPDRTTGPEGPDNRARRLGFTSPRLVVRRGWRWDGARGAGLQRL